MASLLELRGVVSGYGGGRVLQGVDLDVEPHSITCVIGPNGAGKSTLLKTVSGVVRCREGRVALGGEPIHRLSCAQILKRGVVQVPQQGGLFPNLTIRENVLMGGYILRGDRALVRERYAAVEELIPLVAERGSDKAGNLSGGQRRMVEFARSLMLEPSVLLLDEPSLGLDPKGQRQVWDLIIEMGERGRTILLIEQNVRLGLAVASRGVVLEGGRIRMVGPAREVLENADIRDLYLGGTVAKAGAGRAGEPE